MLNRLNSQTFSNFHHFLTGSVSAKNRLNVGVWLILSFAVAMGYGLLSLHSAFRSEFVIQDDARQHIFWMQRFLDPDLFSQDLIADYLESVSPFGFKALYKIIAYFGVNPLLASKILPFILGLISTRFCFGISLQLLPIPAVGFLTSLLLNQGLWMEDDLVSATPRAFVYPLFLAFLYYLLRRSLLPMLGAIILEGLFYPQIALLSIGILTLRLFDSQNWKLQFSSDRFNFWAGLTGLIVAACVLLPYKLTATEFGPIITVAQAQLQPAFNYVDGRFGRAFFFHDNPLIYWLIGPRSGLLFVGILPPLALLGLTLPFLIRRTQTFPLAARISPKIKILTQIIIASVGLFCFAHLVLFKLHFPSRYTYHSLRIVLTLAAGIALMLLIDAQLRRFIQYLEQGFTRIKLLQFGLTLIFGFLLISLPFLPSITLPNQLYRTGKEPQVYEFLQQQPKDILIASTSEESDFIPTLAQRSTLVAPEYDLPYHTGYYDQFRQRLVDLITAQYSSDLTQVQQFIQKYDIDYWLLDGPTYEPEYIATRMIIRQVELVEPILNKIEQGEVFVLSTLVEGCAVVRTEQRLLLEAQCILQQKPRVSN